MTATRARTSNAAFSATPFMRLARTHAGSTAGDAMVAAALAGTIFFGAATSEARNQTFFYLVLTMAPFAVVAPLIGPALDRARSGRRWIVVGSAAVRALLCLALIGRADTFLLYPVAFAILVIQKGYGIARSSLVPGVVTSDEELVEANSKLQLLSGLMGFAGAVPAGLLFKLFDDPAPALALAVCTFSVTAGLGLRIPKVAVAPAAATPEERAEMRGGGVLLAAAGMGLLRGVVGYLTVYYAFHFREEDQLAAFGIVAAVSVLGTLLGSVLAPKLRQVWPEERMLISVLLLTVATGLVSLALGGVAGAAALGGAVGIAATAGKLAFDSIVQRDAPDANRGRLFAKFETRFQLIWVLGAMGGLIPLGEVRFSFSAVALVAAFASFSYVVGLSALHHRSGHRTSTFGRRAARIDRAMTQGKDRVRSSSRSITRRMTPGSRPSGRDPVPDPDLTMVAGPGIGSALPGATHEVRVAAPTGGADDEPDDPTRFAPAPPPPPPADPDPDGPTTPWSDDPTSRLPQ